MRFDLPAYLRAQGKRRRKAITFRETATPAIFATNLYASGYKPLIQAWTASLTRIETAYAQTVQVRDGLITDSVSDIQAAIDEAAGFLTRLVLALTPALRDFAVQTEVWHRAKFRGAALSATGVDLGMVLSPDDVTETVDTFVARNVDLVRNVSDQTRGRIADIVFRGVNQRTPIAQVAREMNEAVGLGRDRARRIASDQATKLTSRLDQARQEEVGISEYTWRHSGKRHPRENHVARNGKVFKWSEPPAGGHPGTEPFCGCKPQAYIADFEVD